MADPRLSASALRALPAITSGVARGLSSSILQDTLSAAGIGVRRTDLLTAIRYVRGTTLAADHLKAIRRDFRPHPARLPLAATRTLREYAYVVRLTGTGVGFSADGHAHVTISSSTSLSRAEIEAEAALAIEEGPAEGRYPGEVTGTTPVAAVRSGRVGPALLGPRPR